MKCSHEENDSTTVDEKETKNLCLCLKDACIVNNGKGVERDPTESAKIFHKLGLAYFKQKHDKLSLINCVGLLNSAIARKPINHFEIEKDLSEVCQYILKKANVKGEEYNLIEQAKTVKFQIESMRNETNQALEFMQKRQLFENLSNSDVKQQHKCKINSMMKIQLKIFAQYQEIMKNLCLYCVDVLGEPPCKFAVVGMGSLAREEITPYSDFEHIILLENLENYEDHLEYFRWFSVIYHTIILNLQETIIPSLNIKYLNDKTCDLGDWFFDTFTNGVAFDGMMPHACKFPLGRKPTVKKPWTTELIKPVEKMLEYLNSEVSLKNGYHLSDMLTETCFVFGNQTLYDEFKNDIQQYKDSKTRNATLHNVKTQVKVDLEKFATRVKLSNLQPNNILNVKQVFYRTSTLFIIALGKIYGTKSVSCFDIINELAKETKISEFIKDKLLLAVAVSCEIRLGIYMKMKSQRDYIQTSTKNKTIFDEILQITDTDTIISYFQITYCLQREVIRLLGIQEIFVYSNPSLINITICYALRQDKEMLSLIKNLKNTSDIFENDPSEDDTDSWDDDTDSSDGDTESTNDDAFTYPTSIHKHIDKNKCIDKLMLHLEEEMCHTKSCIINERSEVSLKAIHDNLLKAINVLKLQQNFGVLFEFWKRLLEIVQDPSACDKELIEISKERNTKVDLMITILQLHVANSLLEMHKHNEAFEQLNRALECWNSKEYRIGIFTMNYLAGGILFKMKQYEKSLEFLQRCLAVYISVYFSYKGYFVTTTCFGIGSSLLKLNEYQEAQYYFKIAIELIEKSAFVIKYDFYNILPLSVTTTYHNFGNCLMKLKKFEDALPYLKTAVEMASNDKLPVKSNAGQIGHEERIKKRLVELANV